jgi:hypothetical protein
MEASLAMKMGEESQHHARAENVGVTMARAGAWFFR